MILKKWIHTSAFLLPMTFNCLSSGPIFANDNDDLDEWGRRIVSKQTIFIQHEEVNLSITEKSFIPNIQGYACPVPAIDIPLWQLRSVALQQTHATFRVVGFGLPVKNPHMRFCHGIPNAKEVFGEQFETGKEIVLPIEIKREIVVSENIDNGLQHRFLRETVTSKLNDLELESKNEVLLEKVVE